MILFNVSNYCKVLHNFNHNITGLYSLVLVQLNSCVFSDSTPGGVLHEAEVTCHCLHRVTCACVTDISSVQYLCENLLPKCVSILVQGALADCSETERLVTNSSVVELVSSIVQIVVQNLDTASAKDVISTMTEMFLDSKLDCLGGAVQNCNTKFQPLQVGGSDLICCKTGSISV